MESVGEVLIQVLPKAYGEGNYFHKAKYEELFLQNSPRSRNKGRRI